MERQTIYCELEFLLRFIGERPINNHDIEVSDEVVLWNKYWDLFHNNSDLYFNVTKETLIELYGNNEFIKSILKNSTRTIQCYQFEKINQEPEMFFNSVNPHAVFFFTDIEKCKEMEENYGMLFISNDTINDDAKFLFQEDLIPISKKENNLNSWDFVSKFKHPCNSLLIVDNYILDKREDIKNNLMPFIKELLPSNLKTDFQIVIITDNKNNKIVIKDCYDLITKELENIGKPYKIVIKIIIQSIDNHDRNLLTNYLWVNSGSGFSIFNYDKNFRKLKIKGNTHFSLYAIASKANVRKVVNSLKEQYKKIEIGGVNAPNRIIVMPETESGKITSRLLNLSSDSSKHQLNLIYKNKTL